MESVVRKRLIVAGCHLFSSNQRSISWGVMLSAFLVPNWTLRALMRYFSDLTYPALFRLQYSSLSSANSAKLIYLDLSISGHFLPCSDLFYCSLLIARDALF